MKTTVWPVFATENDLAVVQTTMEIVGEYAFAINFTFNQKVTAATVTNATNYTVSDTVTLRVCHNGTFFLVK